MYDSFEGHPEVKKYYGIGLSPMLTLLEDRVQHYIIRKHDNGLYCVGLLGDVEHFRSRSLLSAVVQAIVWFDSGWRWFNGEWKQHVDGDGKSVTSKARPNPIE